MKNKQVDMLSGSITKGLLTMTIPIMIMHVMTNMFSIIDMTVLGKYANDTAVGAVGACGTLIALCNGLLFHRRFFHHYTVFHVGSRALYIGIAVVFNSF